MVVERHQLEEGEGLGNGQGTWETLVIKQNAFKRETRHACYEQLTNFRIEQGQKPTSA